VVEGGAGGRAGAGGGGDIHERIFTRNVKKEMSVGPSLCVKS
jgi:hypothetical protein